VTRGTRWILAALAVLALGISTAAQDDIPRPDHVVKRASYVSLDRVPRGAAFEVAVVLDILEGFHINTDKPLQDYLIPTVVRLEPPAGFRLIEIVYPQGKLEKFAFSEDEMAVYEGRVTVRLRLEAAANARLGRQELPIKLRYQACNDRACLPPITVDVPAALEVAPAGTPARPVNQQFFRASR
jgi:DsbC/DsbD-like thiol-disulfide interchange protein